MKLGMPRARWVKVLIQEFEGDELINPNQKYSKYIALHDTTPSEVHSMFLDFLKDEGMIVIKKKQRKRRKKYTWTPEGLRRKRMAIKRHWRERMRGK